MFLRFLKRFMKHFGFTERNRMSTLSPEPESNRPSIALVSISRLQTLCETVAPRYQRSARIFPIREGYGAAVAALQPYIDKGTVDVVLAAGSNGAYLREHLGLPVVMVKVNGFDVIGAITRAASIRPGARVGLVLHESVSQELRDLGAWLNLGLVQRAYRSVDEVKRAVGALAAEGCEVIVGPGMACDVAEQAGLASVFLYSLGAVEEAFERSIELARVSRQKESKRVRLNTIVAHLRDGVAAFDDAGQLEAVNPAMLELLGCESANHAPQRVTQAFGPCLSELASRDAPIEERIEHIGGRALIINCVPIVEHGMRSGAVVTVQDALVAQRIDRSLRTSQRPRHLVAKHQMRDLIGDSAPMAKVRRLAQACAAHDATVLLTGESGTGKEWVAQGIHNASRRRDNPFVAFNCAALPEGLIESELFGHEEGAFTGARRGGKPGLFEMAHTGTIFLDEIGEMPPALQSRLLRVLQERELMKLGAQRATPIDIRVIAATHRDLHALVEQGTFRADLYFRLNLLRIALPALRERRADIPALARHLLDKAVAQYDLPHAAASRALPWLARWFAHYAWPGNVRELENLITRAAIHLSDARVKPGPDMDDLFPELHRAASASLPRPTREDALRVLAQCHGNRAAASRELGIGRTTLWRLLKS